jgi:protocatechuate 3,4-dioxygenase beta subunit
MSPDDAPTDSASPPWWIGIFVGVLALLGLAFTMCPPREVAVHVEDETPQTSGDVVAPPVLAEGPHVRGRVLLEVEVEPPAPIVVVDEDTASVAEDTGADTEGEAPPKVETTTPAAGSCRIRAWQDGELVAPQVTCADDGSYELVLAVGTTGLVAFDLEVPGRLRAVVEAAAPESGIGRLPDVALGVAQIVSGNVTDSRGAAVGSIEITARPQPDLEEPEPWRVVADASGAFAFDTLPPGPIALRVEAEGFAPTVLEVIAPEQEVELVLDRLYDLQGDVKGPPDVLARTRVRVEGSGVWPAREVALVDGTFVFPGIPEGVYALVAIAAATKPGEAELASIPLEDVAPDGHVTLALAVAHRVLVQVVDGRGDPVEGARVTLGAAHLGLLQHHERTDAGGNASLGPVPNGMYVVHADADGYLPAAGVEIAIADASVGPVVLKLARPGTIRGIVVDEDDRRVAEATIEVESDAPFSVGEDDTRRTVFDRAVLAQGSLGVTTGPVPELPTAMTEIVDEHATGPGGVYADTDGAFELTGLVPGTYTLRATHGRFAASDPVEIRVRPGDVIEGVKLRVRTGQPLTGRVLDENARPITNAWIELDDGSAYGTDDRGVFDAGLRRGAVTLVARAPGLVPSREDVRVGSRPVDVELVLRPAEAIVRGHVDDDNGRPIDGVQVTMRAASPLVPTEVTFTDARGQFELGALPLGEIVLAFDHPTHAPTTVHAEAVRRGAEKAIAVVMLTGWTLVVDVRDRDTAVAIADARVVAGDRRAQTDRSGLAQFSALGDDEIDVAVSAADYGTTKVTARRDGDRTTIIVELAAGGSVEGIVTDWAGETVAGARVVIKSGDEVVADMRTDARGSFDAAGLPEGDIVLEAFPPADREDDLAPVALGSDVLRGRTTRGIDLRFERL